jgi:surface protein
MKKNSVKVFTFLFAMLIAISAVGGLQTSKEGKLNNEDWTVKADDNIKTGSWGTCTWTLDTTTGVLTIGTGTGTDVLKDKEAPWHDYCEQIKSVEASANITLPAESNDLFMDCKNATSMNLSGFDASNVTAIGAMFGKCSSLESIDLSFLKTSNVTTTTGMFGECSSLTTLDLSDLDTKNVTDFSYMFANCLKLTTLDLSTFDTSKAVTLYGMFMRCTALKKLDLSNFDTSAIDHANGNTDFGMKDMFSYDSKLWILKLGPKFNAHGTFSTSNLNSASTAYIFTGKWTRGNSRNHEDAITNTELMANYDETYADTWLWEATGTASYTITVDKVDGDAKRLAGADLEIIDSDNKSAANWTSADEACELQLPAGSYTLSETKTPDGYETAEDIKFTITARGTIIVDDNTVDSITMVDKKKVIPTPTPTPTVTPTATPTVAPTVAPTTEPTVAPTAAPKSEPTAVPSSEPEADPSSSQNTRNSNDGYSSPNTGDNTHIMMWGFAAMIAVVGACSFLGYKKKHN